VLGRQLEAGSAVIGDIDDARNIAEMQFQQVRDVLVVFDYQRSTVHVVSVRQLQHIRTLALPVSVVREANGILSRKCHIAGKTGSAVRGSGLCQLVVC
jgi:hypothetical protein